MVVIEITDELKRIATECAARRASDKSVKNFFERKPDSLYVGFVGELVFVKYLKSLNKMYSYSPTLSGVDNGDVIVYTPDKTIIDVKTAGQAHHNYIAIPRQQITRHPDYINVGVRINGDIGELHGYCFASDCSAVHLRNGYKDNVGCLLSELRPIEELAEVMLSDSI